MGDIYKNLETLADKMRAKSAQNPIIKIKHNGKNYEFKYDGVNWVGEINGYNVNFAGNHKATVKKYIAEYLNN